MSEDMDVTARVRAASGRPTWDPHVVEPAPPAGEPVPPARPAMFPPDSSSRTEIRHDDDEDEAYTLPAEAPETARGFLGGPAAASRRTAQIDMPDAELWIWGTVATYKGQTINLEERDVLDITRTCLQAAHRKSTAMLKDLEVKIPRKRRKRKAKA